VSDATLEAQAEAGTITVDPDMGLLAAVVGQLDSFDLWFNIIEP
jgi:hypothetical protein